MRYAPVLVVALLAGALAGASTGVIGGGALLAVLLATFGAILGALLYGAVRAPQAASGARLPLPGVWVLALVLFAGATYASASLLGPAGQGQDRPRPEDYPALAELLEVDAATPDELALLYQVRWALMDQGVAVSEMHAFFQGVVGELRQANAESRVLALRHVLINMNANAANRLVQPTAAPAGLQDLPRGFLPPPTGSCGGTCGQGRSSDAAPAAPAPAPSGGQSCGGSGNACGGCGASNGK